MLAAGDVKSYKQYIFYIGHIKYVLLIGRDVSRGKHHVMKSSPSFLCVGSKVAIHLSCAGREKACESRLLKSTCTCTSRARATEGTGVTPR